MTNMQEWKNKREEKDFQNIADMLCGDPVTAEMQASMDRVADEYDKAHDQRNGGKKEKGKIIEFPTLI